jgi:hypothetical protein
VQQEQRLLQELLPEALLSQEVQHPSQVQLEQLVQQVPLVPELVVPMEAEPTIPEPLRQSYVQERNQQTGAR